MPSTALPHQPFKPMPRGPLPPDLRLFLSPKGLPPSSEFGRPLPPCFSVSYHSWKRHSASIEIWTITLSISFLRFESFFPEPPFRIFSFCLRFSRSLTSVSLPCLQAQRRIVPNFGRISFSGVKFLPLLASYSKRAVNHRTPPPKLLANLSRRIRKIPHFSTWFPLIIVCAHLGGRGALPS